MDSIHHGIYLSSTTPSKPPQSLAVFLDEGKLQSIRGEVIVRANGSKKITTEFDLAGKIEPSVMFSRLIQESFSDELKVKLLQGGSLEEPLFGRDGKLPKITKEPRLPDVQFDQSKPEIPVAPKQSNVPDTQEQNTETEEEKISSELKVSEPQESEPTPDIPSPDDNSLLPASVPEDTLKLEQSKEPVTSEDVMRVADTYFTPETKSVAVYYRKDGGKSKDDPLLVGLSDEQQQQVRQMRAAIAQMDESQLNQFLAQLEQMTDQSPSEMQEVANVVVTLIRTRLGELGGER